MGANLSLLAAFIVAGILGAVGHEVAHWVVWRLTGRHPELDLWKLEVRPRAGPERTTPGDRVAAAAPYVLGVAVFAWGLAAWEPMVMVFAISMVRIPSRADVRTMGGDVRWDGLDVF